MLRMFGPPMTVVDLIKTTIQMQRDEVGKFYVEYDVKEDDYFTFKTSTRVSVPAREFDNHISKMRELHGDEVADFLSSIVVTIEARIQKEGDEG